MSGIRPMAGLVILFVLAVLIAGLWYQSRHPRTIIATSSLTVEGRAKSTPRQVLQIRTVQINQATFQEIELPNGTWIDCAGDCRKAAREAGDEFWSTQQSPRR